MAPLCCKHDGFESRSQSISGMNRPLSWIACSNVHGHTGISAAKLRKNRSERIQLSHNARGQFRPWIRSHCGWKYHASGIGFDHKILVLFKIKNATLTKIINFLHILRKKRAKIPLTDWFSNHLYKFLDRLDWFEWIRIACQPVYDYHDFGMCQYQSL